MGGWLLPVPPPSPLTPPPSFYLRLSSLSIYTLRWVFITSDLSFTSFCSFSVFLSFFYLILLVLFYSHIQVRVYYLFPFLRHLLILLHLFLPSLYRPSLLCIHASVFVVGYILSLLLHLFSSLSCFFLFFFGYIFLWLFLFFCVS